MSTAGRRIPGFIALSYAQSVIYLRSSTQKALRQVLLVTVDVNYKTYHEKKNPAKAFYNELYFKAHRTFATDVACQQRTLTPPDTWSCPFGDLHLFYLLRLATLLMIRHCTSF